ncbi:hepatocyte growth factor receptor isoform X2 [Rhipicephalus microplus]|uniref:hepatocyte growth factor receptor isoform X2 n=1 Tax=Rhipicephalus microplus TaxID=6941 RepID=UPI003F6C5121
MLTATDYNQAHRATHHNRKRPMEQRKNLGHLLAVTLLTLNLTNVLTSEAGIAIETFQTLVGPAQNILYLKLSQHEGVIIVSVRNALYALSPSGLSVRAVYRTGPENDSLMCPPYPLPCSHNRNLTDNISRILLQVGAEPLVLACGVTSQGMCSIHDPLQDLKLTSSMEKKVPDNYVASKRNTVAFFAKRNDGRNVLFAAAVSDGRPPQYRLFPLSARVLNSSGSFTLLSHARAASVGVTNKPRASETLRFVYGFSHNGFVYFVEVRKVLVWSRYSFETRLVRVCENDEPSFRTYVDVPIICPGQKDGLSVATSAHLGPSMTASAGGSDSNASVLAVAFGKPSAIRAKYFALSLSLSAVCFFDMNHVENAFRETVENCNKGLSSARLSPLYHDDGHDLMCSHQETEGRDICGPSRNQYVEGMIPLAGRATITLTRRLATSVAVMKQNGSAVVWIGDSQGILHKVARIPVGSCRVHGTCSQCIKRQEDPLRCGWCGHYCAHFAECADPANFTLERCPVELERVYPLNGPVSGGTVITILGDNLGSPERKPYSSIEILFGNRTCSIVDWSSKQVKCRTPPVQQSSKVDVVVKVIDIFSNTGKSYHVTENRTVPSGFEYKVVSFTAVAPNYGPVAGGTNVSLNGVNLDIGLEHVVKIGRTLCRIRRVENKFLHCSTSSVSPRLLQKMQVRLFIDGAEVPFSTADSRRPTFTYMPNPVIEHISPSNATFSENFTIVANGFFLDSVAAPKILFQVDSLNLKKRQTLVKDCRVLAGGRTMLCPGPSLLLFSVISENELRSHRFRVPAFISFHMDGLHLPPGFLGRAGYFNFYYLPTSAMGSYAEPAVTTAKTVYAIFTGVKPTYGPAAGGTNITLFGSNLDSGTKHGVTIGGRACTIHRVTSTFLECTTSVVANRSTVGQEMQVMLTIDDKEVPCIRNDSLSTSFVYKPNPVIEDISPKRTIFGQNFSVEVAGSHLDSVAQPLIVTQGAFLNQKQKGYIRKECHVVEGGSKMLCPGTALTDSSVIAPGGLKAFNGSVPVRISFQMDGLHLPLAANGGNGHFTLTYQPKPQFKKFPQSQRSIDPSQPVIEIQGNYFELFMGHEPVFVRVNGFDDACNVTNVSSQSIVCKIKPGVLEQGSSLALEVVHAGQSYPVGVVKLVAAEQPGPPIDAIAGSAGAAVVAVVLAGVVSIVCRRHRRRQRDKGGTWRTDCIVTLDKRHNKTDSSAEASSRYVREGNADVQQALMEVPLDIDADTRAMLERENLLIHRRMLHLGPIIGQGHFGCVYLGTMNLEGKGQVQPVAVKTLHNGSRGGEVDSMAFLEEALIMKDFHHVNVLPLIGLSIDETDGLMVIIPYMKYGDLLSYIRDERNTPTVKQLITFGVHVAEGMKYLAETKFVHRDLAARNCMLSEDFIVRVADFGLSRDVYEKDYYSGDNKKTKLPVKWMAPESLEKGIYNHKTDVWSYGVLLWELITRGVTPYPEVDNWDIVDFLKQGRRMKQPSFCPDEMYAIMLKCWHDDPKKRPSFAKLVTDITNILASLEKKQRNKRLGLNVTYINCPPPDPTGEAGPSTESHPV